MTSASFSVGTPCVTNALLVTKTQTQRPRQRGTHTHTHRHRHSHRHTDTDTDTYTSELWDTGPIVFIRYTDTDTQIQTQIHTHQSCGTLDQ